MEKKEDEDEEDEDEELEEPDDEYDDGDYNQVPSANTGSCVSLLILHQLFSCS